MRLLSSQFVSQWDVNVLLHHVCVRFWRRGFNWDLIGLQHLITWPVNPLLFHHVLTFEILRPTLTGWNSMTCLFFPLSHFLHNQFLWVWVSLQCNKHWFICSVRSSRALMQTHSHSHALRLDEIPEPLQWNSSLPSTDSHFFTLFSVRVLEHY